MNPKGGEMSVPVNGGQHGETHCGLTGDEHLLSGQQFLRGIVRRQHQPGIGKHPISSLTDRDHPSQIAIRTPGPHVNHAPILTANPAATHRLPASDRQADDHRTQPSALARRRALGRQ
jgi:hypothetical protein